MSIPVPAAAAPTSLFPADGPAPLPFRKPPPRLCQCAPEILVVSEICVKKETRESIVFGRFSLAIARGLNENLRMSKKIPMKVAYRSSKTGLFVTEAFAKKHPATTEKEHVPVSNLKR